MFSYEQHEVSGTGGGRHPGKAWGWEPLKLAATIAVVAIAVGLVLGTGFWLIGVVFGIFGWIVRVAILVGVAALVWTVVTRHRNHSAW